MDRSIQASAVSSDQDADFSQVALPDRKCEVHQLDLSQDEQAVYDVVFAQSKCVLNLPFKRSRLLMV